VLPDASQNYPAVRPTFDEHSVRHRRSRSTWDASLLLMIAVTNVFNRLKVPTRQPAGAWG